VIEAQAAQALAAAQAQAAAQSKAGVSAAAPSAAAVQAVPAPVAQTLDASSVATQAGSDVFELSKEQRDLEKAAREQAERDAKAADKARK
jgi:hypothetical protein